MIELKYNKIDSGVVSPTVLPVDIFTVGYNTAVAITSFIKEGSVLAVNTLAAVEKVDFSLANVSPIFV